MSINNISNIVLSGNPTTTLNIVDDEATQQLSKLQEDVTQLGDNLATETQNRETVDNKHATDIANLDFELAEKLRVKSGGIVTFTDVFANGEFDVISEIKPRQTGSGDPSLDNIRPITGHNDITLTVSQKNLFDDISFYKANGLKQQPDGTWQGGQDGKYISKTIFTNYAQVSGSFTFSYYGYRTETGGHPLVFHVKYTDGSDLWPNNLEAGTEPKLMQFTTDAKKTVDFIVWTYQSVGATYWVRDMQLEYGSSRTEYTSAYSTTIDFGQTIYGGAFNWSTGELIADRKTIIFDGITTGKKFTSISTVDTTGNKYASMGILPAKNQYPICSHLKNSWSHEYGHIYIANTDWTGLVAFIKDFANVTEANAWLQEQYNNDTPFTVCYELKDPITIYFPPQRIPSLPGVKNQLLCSTGPITAQQNLAVNKAYVDKKLGDSGTNTAEGQYAVALGSNSTAYGDNTFVTGNNSTAYGNGSVAMGESALAGCMGYYIAAIDANQRYIYLSTTTEEVTPVWENQSNHHKPDFKLGYNIYNDDQIAAQKLPTYIHQFSISANAYHHWVFAGDVIEINGNRIKYSEVNNLNGKDVDKNSLGYKKWISNYDSDNDGEGNAKPMKFYIPAQPHTGNITIGLGSHAEGWETIAAGEHSHAEGWYSIAAGRYAHAEGDSTRAGYGAHAEGVSTLASGLESHAEGQSSQATGDFSHAEGGGTQATAKWSHAEGGSTVASGMHAHAEGANTQATGGQSHSEGRQTFATGSYTHAGGYQSLAKGLGSFAHGAPITASSSLVTESDKLPENSTKAVGDYSVAIGQGVQAKGKYSVAFGYGNTANGQYAFAGGNQAQAKGLGSFAFGTNSDTDLTTYPVANGKGSVALGCATKAYSYGSIAIGDKCKAGEQTNTAGSYVGYNAIAGGSNCQAQHANSITLGSNLQTTRAAQAVFGLYNNIYNTASSLLVVGKGSSTSRSNAFKVNDDGNTYATKTNNTGADYAEYFEWQDGNPGAEDRIGYVVTLDEDKIRLAQEGEEILGIISGTAGVVGDSGAMDWQGRFVKDTFGRIIYDEVEEFEEHIDPETNETIRVSLGMTKHPRISPDYDPEQEYIPREERPEWACVGMFGKLYVRDDGTCVPNAYARCVNGILTYSSERTNIKVMKRTDSNIVYVFLK